MNNLLDNIAGTVRNTDGVLDIAGDQLKAIKIASTDNGVAVDVNVVLKFGIRIPEMAWQLQQRIKELLNDAGHDEIDCINIHIRGIRLG